MSKTEVTTQDATASRQEVENLVKEKLSLGSGKAASETVKAVLESILEVLGKNVTTDGFKLKLHGFGQFKVTHKPAKMVKSPKTGETKMGKAKNKIKFVPSSQIRALETV